MLKKDYNFVAFPTKEFFKLASRRFEDKATQTANEKNIDAASQTTAQNIQVSFVFLSTIKKFLERRSTSCYRINW